LVESRRRYPNRLSIVGYLPDPSSGNAVAELSKQILEDRICGVRLHLLQRDLIARVRAGSASDLLDRASEAGLPVALLYRDQKLHKLIHQLSQRHTRVQFVLDHMGHVTSKDDRAPLLSLAGRPNIFVKLSLHYRLSSEPYPWRDLWPLQRDLVKEFSPRRLMWGSNFPMHMNAIGYQERLQCVIAALSWLPEEGRRQILGETAGALWR